MCRGELAVSFTPPPRGVAGTGADNWIIPTPCRKERELERDRELEDGYLKQFHLSDPPFVRGGGGSTGVILLAGGGRWNPADIDKSEEDSVLIIL